VWESLTTKRRHREKKKRGVNKPKYEGAKKNQRQAAGEQRKEQLREKGYTYYWEPENSQKSR